MNTKQVIVVIKNFTNASGETLQLRKGKLAAQAAHAAMAFLFRGGNLRLQSSLSVEEHDWLQNPESAHAKVVVSVESEQELRDIVLAAKNAGLTVHEVIDAGRTEFHGVPTLTCAAIGPHEVSKFVGVTDHLKLL